MTEDKNVPVVPVAEASVNARMPNAQERKDLIGYLCEHDAFDEDTAGEIVGVASIAVFPSYCTDVMDEEGYSGRLLVIVYSGSPTFYEAFTWNAEGKIEKRFQDDALRKDMK